MTNSCFICETTHDSLINPTENDADHLSLIHKLEKCIPEVQWQNVQQICLNCCNQLETIYKFREQCIKSYLNSLNTVNNDENTTEIKLVVEETKTKQLDPICCEYCGTIFANKYLKTRHLKTVHATEKKYACELCDRKFASSVYLNAHKRYHVGERSHICSFCGKGFITASDLYHHEKIHANKRAYRCEMCPKGFNTSSDLHKHKICVHLDRTQWKYQCGQCHRKFPLKTNLDTHFKIHTGERNFQCHLCEKRCINKSVLKRHIESHSIEKCFKCDLCMQSYKYRKNLDLHLAKVHGTEICNL